MCEVDWVEFCSGFSVGCLLKYSICTSRASAGVECPWSAGSEFSGFVTRNALRRRVLWEKNEKIAYSRCFCTPRSRCAEMMLGGGARSGRRRSTYLLCVLASLIIVVTLLQLSFSVQRPQTTLMLQGFSNGKAPHSTRLPIRTDNNSTFSACLLVMDDNHYLIEWLAFHYHVLPLRYLIIAVDPRSKTSPRSILDRWERQMTILKWGDSDFLPLEWLQRNISESDSKAKFILHRERQRNFYPACFRKLQEAGRTWTMVIDVDEFAIENSHFINSTAEKFESSLLNAVQRSPQHDKAACIAMPRLRFGNFEDLGNEAANKTCAPHGFRDDDFLTLRWRWRAALRSRKDNRNPKSMVDVSKIGKANFSRMNTDAHRPVRSHCPRHDLYILNEFSKFSVHHYVGTQQQRNFRRDAREGMKQRAPSRFAEYNSVRHAIDSSVCGWLQDFSDMHGYKQSSRWLEGVGNVSFGNQR